ncbi:hypothetical protein ASG52_16955 [Methylobacterium sp. Leaf456]|nr:BrnA antitoxin family protein [Methylobacterium sp. Leaf456]KQT60934.1 hypothetical protein ASG52_16955 [Methylobacterium sp. Leaf456]
MPRSKVKNVPLLDAAEEAVLQASIAADPDAPELTDAELAGLRPAREVLPPALYEALTRRGRPASPNKRVQVTLRIDPEALAAFKATGPGWQTRINEALVRDAARLRREAKEG